jgi:alkylation response protein AidB-like acyl-CoA dehydrogenase
VSHYKSNLRDLEFNLFEVFGLSDRLGRAPFTEIDVDTAHSILTEVQRLATEDLAASFTDGDRNPPSFDSASHSVTMPDSLKSSFSALAESGFLSLDLPEALGGTTAPRTLWWAMAEMILGANPAIWMYSSGPGFAHALYRLGTDEQRQWAKIFVEQGWGSTMVLTEPDAGSDVGAGRAKAVPQADGSWHIEGVKRFITSAEHDLTENIVHYVLARPVGVEGAGGAGTKGLSLFVVPKFHFDTSTGALKERNGVFVTNVEHKMGLKASTTCELTFGEKAPAVGWLVGGVHEGIAQMFKIIEYARMMVGTKAIATLSTGYLNALDYAKTRVQGADLTEMTDKSAARVTITHHPDVRRSLMLQKSYAEGLRALVLYTASVQDTVMVAKHRGDTAAEDAAERLNDLLLPLVKGCGSERSYELLSSQSLQTFGGSGYLQDYPLEQYVRDAKIDTLYEGTTAIQGMDLFFRKIVRDKGSALTALSAEVTAFLDAVDANDRLKEERTALRTALESVQGMVGAMVGFLMASQQDPAQVYKVGLNTTRLLLSLGDVVVGWLLLRQAEVAQARLDAVDGRPPEPRDVAFYTGKVAAASFFARTVLPELPTRRTLVEATTLDLMDLPEDAF